jgi:hypothetical protein
MEISNEMPSLDISIEEATQASTVKLGSTLVGPLFRSKELQEMGQDCKQFSVKGFFLVPPMLVNPILETVLGLTRL